MRKKNRRFVVSEFVKTCDELFTVFKSVCHGQPWAGNVYFRYEVDSNGEKVPVDAIFTDFQSCSYGRTGQDIAHFLLASTTREFRKNHLETILQAYLTELDDVFAHQGKKNHYMFYCIP